MPVGFVNHEKNPYIRLSIKICFDSLYIIYYTIHFKIAGTLKFPNNWCPIESATGINRNFDLLRIVRLAVITK